MHVRKIIEKEMGILICDSFLNIPRTHWSKKAETEISNKGLEEQESVKREKAESISVNRNFRTLIDN